MIKPPPRNLFPPNCDSLWFWGGDLSAEWEMAKGQQAAGAAPWLPESFPFLVVVLIAAHAFALVTLASSRFTPEILRSLPISFYLRTAAVVPDLTIPLDWFSSVFVCRCTGYTDWLLKNSPRVGRSIRFIILRCRVSYLSLPFLSFFSSFLGNEFNNPGASLCLWFHRNR